MSLTKATYSMIDGAWANALDYGADPTGAADSTSALQNAINSGAPVYIPEGTYLTDVLTARTGNGMQFIGSGIGKTILQEKTANTGVLKNPNGIQFGGNIGHFSVKANASSTGIGYGILVSGFYNTDFHHIEYLSNGAGYFEALFNVAAYPQLCYGNTINNVQIFQQKGPKFGVLFSNGNQGVLFNANACSINNGIIANNTLMITAINACRSINTNISQMLLERNYTTSTITGLQVDAASGINAGAGTCITGNYFEALSPWIFYENPVDGGGDNGFVAGNYFSPDWSTTTNFFNGAKGNVWVGNSIDPLTPITFVGTAGLNWQLGNHDVPADPTIAYSTGTTGTLSSSAVTRINNTIANEITYRITGTWTPTSSGANNASFLAFTLPLGYLVQSVSCNAHMPAFNSVPVACSFDIGSNSIIISNVQTTGILFNVYVTYYK